MANALYHKAVNKFFKGEIDWVDDDIRAVLIDGDNYTVDLSTHEFISHLSGILKISPSLANKSVAAGAAKGDAVTFSGVAGNVSRIVIYMATSEDNTSPLIAYYDTVSGFPINANNADVTITWASEGVFRLVRGTTPPVP